MYVNTFWLGLFVGVVVTFVALVLFATIAKDKKDK